MFSFLALVTLHLGDLIMKKNILLTTTAMLLSAITLNANADSNSAQLHIEVNMVEPFEIIREKYLGFGKVLASGPNKTVIVTTDGKLDPNSTATMLSKATYQNYSDKNEPGSGSFNEGLFQIKNPDLTITEDDEEYLNAAFKVNFAHAEVNLVDSTNGTTCGTVSDFTTRFKPSAEGEMHLHVGGTFTTVKMTQEAHCSGQTTVTIVLNEDVIIAGTNSDSN